MDKQIEVSKIVIRVGDTELSLSVEQARELRDVLDNVLKGKDVTIVPFYPTYPPVFPVYPYPTWTVVTSEASRLIRIESNLGQ